MQSAQWYFDLISPFAYLHFQRLHLLRDRLQITPVPVLFAGMLKHWDTKGPAELPTKRLHTYQYCVWTASQQKVPFRMPPRHPFNPLKALRLLIAAGVTDASVAAAFDFIFAEGRDPEREFAAFAAHLGVADGEASSARPDVKQILIDNTERAIAQGVFGVPTLVVNGELFWGNDTVEWTSRFLDEPALFQQSDYVAAAQTGAGVVRF